MTSGMINDKLFICIAKVKETFGGEGVCKLKPKLSWGFCIRAHPVITFASALLVCETVPKMRSHPECLRIHEAEANTPSACFPTVRNDPIWDAFGP